MAIPTSWLIGAIENLSLQAFTVDGGAPGVQTVAAGDYYLIDDVAAISLAKQFELALEADAGITAATVRILENRKIEVVSDDAFTVTWGTATQLRDLFGFTGDLTPSGNSFTAPNVSKLMWSPGRTETPTEAPLGVTGDLHYDTVVGIDAAGTELVATQNNSRRVNTFMWRFVTTARYWDTAETGGTYRAFFDQVLKNFFHWQLHRNVQEDLSGSTVVTLLAADKLGPYKMRARGGGVRSGFTRERGFQNIDAMHSVQLPAVVVAELT